LLNDLINQIRELLLRQKWVELDAPVELLLYGLPSCRRSGTVFTFGRILNTRRATVRRNTGVLTITQN
jgi:hypothetical protein